MNDVASVTAPSREVNALRSSLSSQFDVVEDEVIISGTRFALLKVLDTNKLVDEIKPEEFSTDERLPYWAELWPSSIVLAERCLLHQNLAGKQVLELGCGLGLAGIAAAKAGAHVTFSDYESHSLEFSRHNAMVNLTNSELLRIEFLLLDWRRLPLIEPFDIIIAADCVYERRNFFPLLNVLTTLLKPDGFALFTEPGRSIGEVFFPMLKEEGFEVETTLHSIAANGKNLNIVRALIRRL